MDVLHHEAHRIVPGEGGRPGQELEEDHPGGVEIRRSGHRGPQALLGGQVLGRAADEARAGQGLLDLIAAVELGDAEVQDLHKVFRSMVAREEDVLGLEVPMDDVLGVRLLEGLHELTEDPAGAGGREGAVLLEALRQGPPLEELHRQVELPTVAGAEVEHVDGVGVAQLAGCGGLTLEAGHVLGVHGHLGGHDLQRDHLVHGDVGRAEDVAHAAASDELLDAVSASEHLADQSAGLRHPAPLLGMFIISEPPRHPNRAPTASWNGRTARCL